MNDCCYLQQKYGYIENHRQITYNGKELLGASVEEQENERREDDE